MNRSVSPETAKKIADTPILAEDKAALLLALLGLKRSTSIVMLSDEFDDARKPKHVDAGTLTRIYGILTPNAYHYAHTGPEVISFQNMQGASVYQERRTFYVSKNKDDAARLKELQEAKWNNAHNNNKEIDAELGRMYGYPETAAQAFINGDTISVKEVEDLMEKEVVPYTFFKLSREWWRQEYGVCEEWSDAVKDASPELHEQVMEEYFQAANQ